MKLLQCASIDGIEAYCVDVEASFTKGLPGFSIVGLANSSIQESKERVKSALISNEFKFPPLKITINLSPSDLPNKTGSHFDLPIALLIALQNKTVNFEDFFVLGELGLDGKLKDTSSIFVILLSLVKQGKVKNILVPKDSVEKLSFIPNIDIYAVDTLQDAIAFFESEDRSKYKVSEKSKFDYKWIEVAGEKFYYTKDFELDFNDVKGQNLAKKAAMISAAGLHNIIFNGSPGCGKSMITKRMQYILPPMSINEILEKVKIQLLEGDAPEFIPNRIFRSPHHTSTKASIFGGGSANAKIGEVALANNGILFFDELPHFSKVTLEALREPLEDHKILVSRVNNKINYPSKFLFVGAQNPCPCGNLLSNLKECRCNDLEIQRYKNKLSDPFLDRIDLHVIMNDTNYEEASSLTSEDIFKKIIEAFKMQKQRGQKELNGKLDEKSIEQFCVLNDELKTILNRAISEFSLSLRAINKVIKVSRTIADLEQSEVIEKRHLLESFSYRFR